MGNLVSLESARRPLECEETLFALVRSAEKYLADGDMGRLCWRID
jgi:hypothetical protein